MKSFCLIIILFFTLSLTSGCIAYQTYQTEMGRPLDPAQVAQIIEGKTTEAEAVALLGPPQQIMERPDGSKTLMYSYSLTQLYGITGSVNTVGNISSKILFLNIRDGLVKKKWGSSSNTPLGMTTNQTLVVPGQSK
jgi:amino acid transporter